LSWGRAATPDHSMMNRTEERGLAILSEFAARSRPPTTHEGLDLWGAALDRAFYLEGLVRGPREERDPTEGPVMRLAPTMAMGMTSCIRCRRQLSDRWVLADHVRRKHSGNF
jgi:hypothetical protein